MAEAQVVPKIRPGWHSDAKWVVGILLLAVVAVGALLSGLYRVTERDSAVKIMATATATMFSPNGLDDAGDIEIIRAQIKKSNLTEVKPLPMFPITLTRDEVMDLSPRQLRILIFERVTAPIYDGDYEQFLPADQEGGDIASQVGLLALMSADNHDLLGQIVQKLLIVAAVLLLLLIYFSYGFGRLLSPGFIALAVGLPGLALFFLLRQGLTTGTVGGGQYGPLIGELGPVVTTPFISVYQPLAFAGAGLVALGLLGKFIWLLVPKKTD